LVEEAIVMLVRSAVALESGHVIRFYRMVGIVLLVLSIVGFFLALWTGGLVVALHELLGAIGLVSRSDDATPYPLGAWTLVIYVLGAVLGCFVHRCPVCVGSALVPLGIVGLMYGGPIARVYGMLILAAGVFLIGMVLYRRRNATGAAE
jgi:hypothetical protein